MNIQEAFETLGLESTASKSDIKEKHRNLIKDFHSDKENGNHEKSSLINNARDVSLKYVDEKANVALIKQVVDIVSVSNAKIIQQIEYKSQSESLYSKMSRKIGSRYKSYKSIAKTFGLISAIIALLSTKLLPLVPNVSTDPSITISFTFLAVITGIIYLSLNSTAERIQYSIDDLKDTLSDKGSYYDILNDILKCQKVKTKSISRYEFEELCDRWFHIELRTSRNRKTLDSAFQEMFLLGNTSFKSTIERIGMHDFVKFLISKGLEKNILLEKESFDFGITEIKYEINQKAST